MNQTLELAPAEKTGAVAVRDAAPNIAGMLQAVIERGVTGENVKALESLVTLYERCEARDAEKAFAVAFNKLQSEMPKVQARKAVPNNDGTPRYTYAPYEEIMAQVSPMLLKHGFTVTFSQDFAEGRLIESCTLQHIGGHSRTNKFAVRVGSGPRGTSEAQADGAAATYAKRFALCNALNITIETDSDARAEGDTITPEQAMDLKTRVTSLGMNEPSFLRLGQAKTYAEIRTAVYPVLCEVLRRKEAKA